MSFTVAIVGRPNVGKSTLFNRLTGKRHALVDDQPGVTRDRREGAASLGGMAFTVVDTAGLEQAEKDTLAARMTDQSTQAIKDADVALLVVDGRVGITPIDRHFAQIVRKSGTPVILLVNKAEGGKASATISEAHGMGLGEPVAISAEHGEGLADLYDALAPYDKSVEGEEAPEAENINTPMQIAIVGRPNVGKSTLLNKILGEERVLTGPEAGITRDAIAIDHEFKGKPIKLIDTAGMRRKANVQQKVEKLAVADTLRAIQYAHVVVLVIDAEQPLEKQEATIASLVEQEGRAMVLAVNKWDTVGDKPAYEKAIKERLAMVLPQVKGVPMVPISAIDGSGIGKLLTTCFSVYALWNTEIGTGELNRWLEAAILEHTPPMVNTRRIKIRYMTQKSARPPSFLLFSNTSDIPESYLRYLVNSLRVRFALPGIPIRVRIRKNKNPYAGEQE
ncbi:MAG: ribosome biogenesis GTPase Der [Rickettsiales bacterium]|nr:ribosome biogenesis GTPase Der [Rickettsiales bacterium]